MYIHREKKNLFINSWNNNNYRNNKNGKNLTEVAFELNLFDFMSFIIIIRRKIITKNSFKEIIFWLSSVKTIKTLVEIDADENLPELDRAISCSIFLAFDFIIFQII